MTNPKQAAFLEAYSITATISGAARAAGIDRKTHYRWLDEHEEYAQAFALAHEEACEALEAEARRRAVEGIEEPVIYQGALCHGPDGKLLTQRKHSDTMLIFLMKAAKPEKYRDNFRGEVKELFKSRVDLSALSDDDLKTLETLAKKASLKAA